MGERHIRQNKNKCTGGGRGRQKRGEQDADRAALGAEVREGLVDEERAVVPVERPLAADELRQLPHVARCAAPRFGGGGLGARDGAG